MHSFAQRFLIFKLQQEVLKFNDISLSWSSPNTDLKTNFFNLQNRSLRTLVLNNNNNQLFGLHQFCPKNGAGRRAGGQKQKNSAFLKKVM